MCTAPEHSERAAVFTAYRGLALAMQGHELQHRLQQARGFPERQAKEVLERQTTLNGWIRDASGLARLCRWLRQTKTCSYPARLSETLVLK